MKATSGYNYSKFMEELKSRVYPTIFVFNIIQMLFTRKRYGGIIRENWFLISSSMTTFKPVNVIIYGKIDAKDPELELSYRIIPNFFPYMVWAYISYRVGLMLLYSSFSYTMILSAIIIVALLVLLIFSSIDEVKNAKAFLYGQLVVKEKL